MREINFNPGRLKFSVAIQQNTAVRGADGAYGETWTTFASGPADISSQGGREFVRAQQVDSELTQEITMRYISGVTPAMRVLFVDAAGVSRYWDIRAVVADYRYHVPEYMALHCRGINQ